VRVVVQHRSRYHYPRPALLGPQLIRLRPADHTRARIESYQLLVEPEPHRAERRLCGDTIRAADVAEGSKPPARFAPLNDRSRSLTRRTIGATQGPFMADCGLRTMRSTQGNHVRLLQGQTS